LETLNHCCTLRQEDGNSSAAKVGYILANSGEPHIALVHYQVNERKPGMTTASHEQETEIFQDSATEGPTQ